MIFFDYLDKQPRKKKGWKSPVLKMDVGTSPLPFSFDKKTQRKHEQELAKAECIRLAEKAQVERFNKMTLLLAQEHKARQDAIQAAWSAFPRDGVTFDEFFKGLDDVPLTGWTWTTNNGHVSLSGQVDSTVDSSVIATGVDSGTTLVSVSAMSEGVELSGSLSITVTDPEPDKAHLNTASSTPNDWTIGQAAKQQVVFILNEPDDGTYTYVFGATNGAGTGAGYIYHGDETTPVNGVYTGSPVFYWDTSPRGSTVHSAGTPTSSCTITDSYGTPRGVSITGTVHN